VTKRRRQPTSPTQVEGLKGQKFIADQFKPGKTSDLTQEPADVRPLDDYSPSAAAKRELVNRAGLEDYRRIVARAARPTQEPGALGAPSQVMGPITGEVQQPIGIAGDQRYYSNKASELLHNEYNRRSGRDISKYPIVQDIIDQAAEADVDLTANDIENLVDWGTLNSAADRIISLSQVDGGQVGVRNVYLTLQETNPLMASLLPDIVTSKIIESIEDPNLAENIIAAAGTALMYVVNPLIEINEWAMQGLRASEIAMSEREEAGESLGVPLAQEIIDFFSPEARSKVQKDKFNEVYINEIRESGNYSNLEVEVAYEVLRRAASGDPEPINSTFTDMYLGNPEAAAIFQDMSYNFGGGRVGELVRQIDSASLGNTGQVIFGSARPAEFQEYDPSRGSKFRQDAANVTGFTVSILGDPTLVGSKIFRVVQASRWTLNKLAPGGQSASKVLKQMKIGKLSISNPAYRYFDNFTQDLNRLDDLEKAASAAVGSEKVALQAQAAGLRNRMTRQYDEMPEDLIEDFRTLMPRNADGKFDVQTAARYIDETNDAYITATGNVSDEVAAMGATVAEIPALVRKILDEKDIKTFAQRVGAQTKRRTPLVPRMSPARAIRQSAVNDIIAGMMPTSKAIKLIDNYIGPTESSKEFAERLSEEALELGASARRLKFTPGEGWFDSLGRLFVSIVQKTDVGLTSASDAREVYRYARAFLPRRTSEVIADAFRNGDVASRSLLISGLIRSAAAARGITMTKQEADTWVRQLTADGTKLATGTRPGERYGVTVLADMTPTQRYLATRETAKVTDEAATLADEALESGPLPPLMRSLSADRNGIESALHLDQASNRIALPSIREFEQLRADLKVGVIPWGRARNAIGTGFQRTTDYWSVGTLFGFRFSLRNAIEEVGLYWAMGGKLIDLYRGRQASQAIRKVQPRVYVRVPKRDATDARTPLATGAEPEVVFKSSLGMFANKIEWLKRVGTRNPSAREWLEEWNKHKGFRYWFSELVLPATRYDDSLIAMQQFAKNEPEAFAKLAIAALASMKAGTPLRGIRASDEAAFEYLVNSPAGFALLDEIAEAGKYLNSGGFPDFMLQTRGIMDDLPQGVGQGQMVGYTAPLRGGEYGNLPVVPYGINGQPVYGAAFWWREMQRTLDGDGPIGALALIGIRSVGRGSMTPQEAKASIAKAIREDTTMGYRDRLRALNTEDGIDDFADRYFENAFQHFTRRDGSINDELVEVFFNDRGEFLGWWKEAGEGLSTPRVSMNYLKKFKDDDVPEFVFGRELVQQPWIPVAETLPGILTMDRAWTWMGAQNARISREPLFLANYFDQFAKTAPARKQLAEAMAKSKGRAVTEIDNVVASQVYAKSSLDNAFNLTLSYIDNPANRSALAWRSRNVSRYYRAQEDFARRLGRVAQNSPETFWKLALIYHNLDDTGFVYTDDNGDKYFAYPGNELLQSSTQWIASKWFGIDMTGYESVDPFSIGGKVLGIAPSTDPNQIPSFMGPLAGGSAAAIFSAFPSLAGLRSVVLGSYSQGQGNFWDDIAQAIAPAGLTRILRSTDPEMVESSLLQSGMDTIALMLAEGMFNKVTITDANGVVREVDGASLTAEEFKATDQYKIANVIAVGSFYSKQILSWLVASAPQMYSNTSTEFARRYGIDSMKDAQRDMRDMLMDPKFVEYLEQHAEGPSPFAVAQAEWYSWKVTSASEGGYDNLDSLLPYTYSRYKSDVDGQPLAALAGVKATQEVVDWTRGSEAKMLDSAGYGDVKWFLAPHVGEFDWAGWHLLTTITGIKVKKTENEMIEEMLALTGKRQDNIIRRSYEQQIANAQSAEEVKRLNEAMTNDRKENRLANPAWDREYSSFSGGQRQSNARLAISRTKNMLGFLLEKNGKLSLDQQEIDNAINIYFYYESRKKGLVGTRAQQAVEKERLDAEMNAALLEVSEQSEIARNFVESVIEDTIFDSRYFNKQGVN
jgi:hypothetical protein